MAWITKRRRCVLVLWLALVVCAIAKEEIEMESEIQYVLEPFERSHDAANTTDLDPATAPLYGIEFSDTFHNVSIVEPPEALYGNGALRLDFPWTDSPSAYHLTSELSPSITHYCFGATHASFFVQGNGLVLRGAPLVIAVRFLDDKEEEWQHKVEMWGDDDPTAEDGEWREVRIPVGALTGRAESFECRIQQWRIEWETTGGGFVLLDHLSFVGGGDMMSALLHTNERTWSAAVGDETTEVYYRSEVSQNLTKHSVGGGNLTLEYTVEQKETWGGYINFVYLAPSRAYFNLSNADAIGFRYSVTEKATETGRAHLRLIMVDASACADNCHVDQGIRAEHYYSFHHILDVASEGDIRLGLSGNSFNDQPFWRTSWYGVAGNDRLDKESIKGFRFEISLDDILPIGSTVSGALEISQLHVYSASELDEKNSLSSNTTQCYIEPGLNFLSSQNSNWTLLAFQSPASCQLACNRNATCSYAILSGTGWSGVDCYLIEQVHPENIVLLNNGIGRELEATVFWKDKQEEYCDVCRCEVSDQLIDCRGMDLRTLPTRFSGEWTPTVLDLRNNDQISMLLSLKNLSMLEEILLPSNMVYISPSIAADVPNWNAVKFEHSDPAITNVILKSSQAFSDVCCEQGDVFALGESTLTFCDLKKDEPGIDAVYEEFIHYTDAETIQTVTESSRFMAEAASSAENCAEYCHRSGVECKYFAYDARSTNTEHVCHFLATQGTPERVCCSKDHYEDYEAKKPGWTSGRVPRTRNKVDNARVIVSTSKLVAQKANSYTVEYTLSLGSNPLRGAVWVEPMIAKAADGIQLSLSPARVVLYDNETVASIIANVSIDDQCHDDQTVLVTNLVKACDSAFLSNLYLTDDDLDVLIAITLPAERFGLYGILPIMLMVVFFVVLFSYYAVYKRRQADAIWHINTTELRMKEPAEVLGCGSFGNVVLAEYRGTLVAVKPALLPRKSRVSALYRSEAYGSKEVCTNDIEEGPRRPSLRKTVAEARTMVDTSAAIIWEGKSNKRQFVKEMRVLSKLRNPCIATIMGAVIERNKEPLLVIEYMNYGSLANVLRNETVVFDGETILPILRDITQGVRFLHASNPQILHGDLKASNILVDARFHAKVSDYGFSLASRTKDSRTAYAAPEILCSDIMKPTTMSDVYAFGVILYEIYTRKEPYEEENLEDILHLVADDTVQKRPTIPLACPSEIQKIMKQCWDGDPSLRPTFANLDMQLKALNICDIAPDINQSMRFKKRDAVVDVGDYSLMNEVFPAHVSRALRAGRKVEPESHDMVTIIFSDIVGFTNLSATLSPIKVSDMLDRLYTEFDSLSRKHEVFKVETIGDSWMGVTNLTEEQPDHAKRIADFSIDAVAVAKTVLVDVDDKSLGYVDIRVGFHSGPVVANVVGSRNPRYCLFGDSVNTASRMESHSSAGRIQCSEASKELLQSQDPVIKLRLRGLTMVKGKGLMRTFWVNEKSEAAQSRAEKVALGRWKSSRSLDSLIF